MTINPNFSEPASTNKQAYVGGLLEMANARLYPFWGNLTEALKTGRPQNEARHGGDLFLQASTRMQTGFPASSKP